MAAKTLQLKDGVIVDVKAEGSDETEGIGSRAILELPALILEANNPDVDTVSGATFTSRAIITAAKDALRQASGDGVLAAKMKPGTYTAEGRGFGLSHKIKVTVTVDESKILDIEVDDKDNVETDSIRDDTVKVLVPRIIEHQSVSIDSLTGATATSAGIKEAVMLALQQALKEGGSDPAAIAAFQILLPKSTAKETLDVDVLVVGLGGSGMFASLSAAEKMNALVDGDNSKVNVLAIEKGARISGTASVTGDIMSVNPKRMMDELNEGKPYVDEQEFWDDWMDFCLNDPKEEILKMFFEKSGDAIDWAHYDHEFTMGEPGTGFTPRDRFNVKHQAPNGHAYGNYKRELAELHYRIMDQYEELGGKYMLETEAYELLYDKDSKSVNGVKARKSDGTEYVINAKSVILATGGFIGNAEMQEELLSNEYYPLKGVWKVRGWTTNDGKMIKETLNIGAGTYNIGMPPMIHVAGSPQLLTKYKVHEIEGVVDFWTSRTATWSVNDVPIIMTTAPNTLQLDKNGNRFGNEAAVFGWWKAGPTYWTVWSEEQVKEIEKNGFKINVANAFIGQGGVPEGQPVPEIYDVLNDLIDLGAAYKADTLEEAAAATGMNADNLKNAVEKYNEAAKIGEDKEYGKDAELLDPLTGSGPYYVLQGASYAYSTCGGLDINDRLQVLNTNGEIIKGLYAVGTDSMGTLYSERNAYVSYGGAAQGWCLTSGYVAGKAAVEDALK